jgi:hypothetical protein
MQYGHQSIFNAITRTSWAHESKIASVEPGALKRKADMTGLKQRGEQAWISSSLLQQALLCAGPAIRMTFLSLDFKLPRHEVPSYVLYASLCLSTTLPERHLHSFTNAGGEFASPLGTKARSLSCA